jgi:hypothetical protein
MASLQGKTIVFTGFRDKKLEKNIAGRGGRVASSVSLQTDVLVASGIKGVQSAKAKKAREQGVRVMSRVEFDAEFFPPTLWDRVLGEKATIKPPKEQCYVTLDNGGQAFKVCYNRQSFWVFKPNPTEDYEEKPVFGTVAVKPTKYKRVLIGRSPVNAMTKFSGGHGPRFDGNSMLFELVTPPTQVARTPAGAGAGRTYMFVGECVRVFRTPSPIVSFVSPVGNSGTPYPFAVDRTGSFYLMVDMVKITVPKAALTEEVLEDPYGYYYDRGLLTPDMGLVPKGDRKQVEMFEGITKFYIGSKQYTFRYGPHPEKDFDRFLRFDEVRGHFVKKPSNQTTPVSVVAHGEKKKLSKKEYVALMRRVGKQRGFAPLNGRVIVERDF